MNIVFVEMFFLGIQILLNFSEFLGGRNVVIVEQLFLRSQFLVDNQEFVQGISFVNVVNVIIFLVINYVLYVTDIVQEKKFFEIRNVEKFLVRIFYELNVRVYLGQKCCGCSGCGEYFREKLDLLNIGESILRRNVVIVGKFFFGGDIIVGIKEFLQD